MRNEITKITLNEELTKSQEACRILTAVSNKNILVEKGGYVFKAGIKGSHLFLGLMPGILANSCSRYFPFLCRLLKAEYLPWDILMPVLCFALIGNYAPVRSLRREKW